MATEQVSSETSPRKVMVLLDIANVLVEIKSEAVSKASVVFLNMVVYSFIAVYFQLTLLALLIKQIKQTSFG